MFFLSRELYNLRFERETVPYGKRKFFIHSRKTTMANSRVKSLAIVKTKKNYSRKKKKERDSPSINWLWKNKRNVMSMSYMIMHMISFFFSLEKNKRICIGSIGRAQVRHRDNTLRCGWAVEERRRSVAAQLLPSRRSATSAIIISYIIIYSHCWERDSRRYSTLRNSIHIRLKGGQTNPEKRNNNPNNYSSKKETPWSVVSAKERPSIVEPVPTEKYHSYSIRLATDVCTYPCRTSIWNFFSKNCSVVFKHGAWLRGLTHTHTKKKKQLIMSFFSSALV